MNRNTQPSFVGKSIAVRYEDRANAAPPLGTPQSLVVGIGAAGLVVWLSTDVEDAAGLIPEHMKGAGYTVVSGVPLEHPVQVGQPFTAPA